jgi:retron-type reverse transcriptase
MIKLQTLQAARTLGDVADILHFQPHAVSYLLYKQDPATKYYQFTIPKRTGGLREISAPCDALKLLQRNLATLMQDCVQELLDHRQRKDRIVHGFRKHHSIITNARRHRNRRWVFNIDLKNFFPTIHLGRIRGYLIKNRDWVLTDKVATVLAQIACHNGVLPQGSPCSPVFGNLIAHVLDMRILRLVTSAGCTYSRYADDLTFSPNKKDFPSELAVLTMADNGVHTWLPSYELRSVIERSGFQINDRKTNMMYKRSRQEVTGLVVNQEIRPRPEYRRLVRAMVHKYVTTGEFETLQVIDNDGVKRLERRPGDPDQLHGMLGFVDSVRYKEMLRKASDGELAAPEHKRQSIRDRSSVLCSEEKTYRQFLLYRLFYDAKRPTILCEGDTDNIYLTHAIRSLAAQFPELAEVDANGSIRLLVRLFRHPKSSTTRLLMFKDGGSGALTNFISSYKEALEEFVGPGLQHPIIVLFDDDKGGIPVRAHVGNITKTKVPDAFPFIHVVKNLYAVATPGKPSSIEDCFTAETRALTLGDKTFNQSNKKLDNAFHYSKRVFAEEIVARRADKIDFSGFVPLLTNLAAAIRRHRESLLAADIPAGEPG